MARTNPTGSAILGVETESTPMPSHFDRTIAEDAAQKTLVDLHAFDIGKGDFVRAHGEEAVFFDKTVACNADLGGPFADHHPQEGDQPQHEQQTCSHRIGIRLFLSLAEGDCQQHAGYDLAEPGSDAVSA